MEDHWCMYLVRCKDGSLYTGITTNLPKRVADHNSGRGAKYTASRRPVQLVYFEEYDNVSKARNREHEIKGWSKTKKEGLIVGFPRAYSG